MISSNRKREVEFNATSFAKVLDFCNTTLEVQVRESNVSITYRFRHGQNAKHPLILVHFTRCIVRDKVLRAARSKLKEYNVDRVQTDRVYIDEDLIDSSRTLLGAARSEGRSKHIHSVWSNNSYVMVKAIAGSTSVHLQSTN